MDNSTERHYVLPVLGNEDVGLELRDLISARYANALNVRDDHIHEKDVATWENRVRYRWLIQGSKECLDAFVKDTLPECPVFTNASPSRDLSMSIDQCEKRIKAIPRQQMQAEGLLKQRFDQERADLQRELLGMKEAQARASPSLKEILFQKWEAFKTIAQEKKVREENQQGLDRDRDRE